MTESPTQECFNHWRGVNLSTLAIACVTSVMMVSGNLVDHVISDRPLTISAIGSKIATSFLVGPISAPAVWLVLVLVGLPTHFGLMKLGLTRWWQYALAGQIIGICFAILVRYSSKDPLHQTGIEITAFYLFLLLSGLTAGLFWHFGQTKPRGRRGP